MRVLDIDLDFFVHGVAYYMESAGPRLSDDDYRAWSPEEALQFLQDRCHLSGKLPGWVVENHGDVFPLWRSAVRAGRLRTPFHVTHVDAHADLGLGDAGYMHLITDVMYRPVDERDGPEVVEAGIGDGNWLAYAVACQWVSDIDYVFCSGGGDDLLRFHMTQDGQALQLKAASRERLEHVLYRPGEHLVGEHHDPEVPLRQIRYDEFTAAAPYDAIVLCRSPGFTPAAADAAFDAIRKTFVEENGQADLP